MPELTIGETVYWVTKEYRIPFGQIKEIEVAVKGKGLLINKTETVALIQIYDNSIYRIVSRLIGDIEWIEGKEFHNLQLPYSDYV